MADDLVISDVSLLDGRRVDIRVAGTQIAEIGSAGGLEGGNRIACDGGLCVRPLSDAHIHIDKAGTALLGSRVPATIPEAIAAMAAFKREALHTPTTLRERMIRVLRSLHGHGTVAVRALVDVDESWGLTAFRAACEAREALSGTMEVTIEVFPQEGLTPLVADLLREAAATGADAIGAHTDVDEDWVSAVGTAAEIARETSLPLQVHVDEAASPESFRMPRVLELTAGVNRLALAHCLSLATLDNGEQDRWARRLHEVGAWVVVAPSILSFGMPLAPVARLMDAGVKVLLGSDNLQDVFVPVGTGRLLEAARTVALLARLIDPAAPARLIAGATDAAYAFITGQAETVGPGSPATLAVFSGRDARAVLLGEDATRLGIFRGQITWEQKV